MADQFLGESSSNSGSFSGGGSDLNVELNVKTLDSRIFHFQVDRNMTVSAFKEQIANVIGITVGQQRLIFRGKVLKDDHPLSEYHVENGDTLHLVERQPAHSQPSSGSGDANGSSATRGTESSAGASRNRIGQISHSVVLGTFNVGDQGEGGVPDISQVIGAVLNSVGLGGLAAASGGGNVQSSVSLNIPGQGPRANESATTNVGGQNVPGSQPLSGQRPSNQPTQSAPGPQVVQIPLVTATTAIPVPSINLPLPDSLSTLLEFMTRMEQSFTQNGYRPSSSSTDLEGLRSNAQGLPTLEALSIVLRRAQQLLSGHSIAAISHIAGRLEREGASSDSSVRGQIQAEASQIGIAMQHMGALFLELGRTMLTLRMGQTPESSFVNAGPAVYISPSGPNPIMVQPFPLQGSSLFGGSVPPPNPVAFGPVGVGNPPRHVNIHILAGTSLAPVVSALGNRASNLEGMQGQRSETTGSGDPSAIRPASNVIATSIPSQISGPASSSALPSNLVVSASQPHSESAAASSLISNISSHLRNLVGNMQEGNQVLSGQTESVAASLQPNNMVVSPAGDPTGSLAGLMTDCERAPHHEDQHRMNPEDLRGLMDVRGPPHSLESSPSCSSEDGGLFKLEGASSSNEKQGAHEETCAPLGLGRGGLERKRRSKQSKPPVKSGNGTSSAPVDQNELNKTAGQQVFQTLLSQSLNQNRRDVDNQPTGASLAASAQVMDTSSPRQQGPDGQADTDGLLSQVLGSPALNGLLGGVSESGVGSSNSFRNLLQQVMQSPEVMNTASQIAQQVDPQDVGSIFSAMGGQGGRINLQRMFQQMMPIVSQALGGISNGSQLSPEFDSELQRPPLSENVPYGDDVIRNSVDQINLQHVAQNIDNFSPPDIFNSMVENAVRLYGNSSNAGNIMDALCEDEDLARDYVEILRHDVSRRLQGDSGKE